MGSRQSALESPIRTSMMRRRAGRRARDDRDVLSQARAKKKPIIGLAGGIGAGKTLVAGMLESLGARVIDFDRLAHEELCSPDVLATLRSWWGDSVCSAEGKVDRQAVASIVFAEPDELGRLEGLLYPRIGRCCEQLLAASAADPGVKAMVLDAPKLFEAGLNELCDTVIFVEADFSDRARRVAESRGWTEQELIRRENLQNPLDTKKAVADHVVINQSGADVLREQVAHVFSLVLASRA